uniref:Uncharacterized protein n=1 Tax=Lepisosteus oculatus TaxID=7918 RepID=W5MIV0_LEPOC
MTGLLSALLLVPIRLCLRLQSLCYWALVYSTAGLTATLVLTRITWRGLRAPRHVFRWTMRQQPPACLRDPVLGEHSYLRGMVSEGAGLEVLRCGVQCCVLGYSAALWGAVLCSGVQCCVLGYSAVFWGIVLHCGVQCCGLGYSAMVRGIVLHCGVQSCESNSPAWGGGEISLTRLDIVCFLSGLKSYVGGGDLPALNRTFKPHPQSASHLPILSDTVRLSISPLPVPFHPASQLVRSLMTGRWVGIQNRARRLTEQELEAYLYQLSQPGGLAGPLSYYRSLCSDTPLRHQDVGVACLLLWGEADAFLGPGLARASRAYMRGSCAVRIVPGCSHWVQQDQPEAVNGLIWAFLREGGRGGSTRNNH